MTPTPPSPDDDILDLSGLDTEPRKSKASTPESDFEKELEALFAEDLTEIETKTPPPAAPAGEDILTLDDLAAEPAASAAPAQDDVLDLGDFAASEAPAAAATAAAVEVLDLGAFAAPAASDDAAPAAGDDDVLDLGAFAAGGELDITPPDDTAGGKDGGIDTAALDDLISGLGDSKEPAAEELPPHDDTDMSDLLETLNVSKAAAPAEPAVPAAPADEMLELTLGDLVEEAPAVEPVPVPEPAPAAELPDLDISLPDFSEPEPAALADLEPEAPVVEDMGGGLNLSLAEEPAGTAPADELDVGGMMEGGLMEGGLMEGLETAGEPAPEQSLDAASLLEQIPDDGTGLASEPQPGLIEDAGLVVAAAAVAAAAAEEPVRPAAAEPIAAGALQELQEKLAALATQVMGGSVAVVRLEGQLAEKDQAMAALERRLQSSQDEADMLRRELSDLRAQLEESLRQRAQADDRAATELKERLALVEDRQIQLDRDVRTEIERAVPREAARVIREEIAALAASMHEE